MMQPRPNRGPFLAWRQWTTRAAWLAALVALLLALAGACTNPPVENGNDPPADDDPPSETGKGAWTTLPSSSEPRQEVSYVHLDGTFYLTGGDRAHEAYDPTDETWTQLAPLPGWRDHIQGVTTGGKIYYIGGIVEWPTGDRDEVYIYEPDSDSFTEGMAMPRSRGAGGVAAYHGKIYYAGGLHDGEARDWFDVYDPATDTWEELPPMPHVRDHFHAAVVEGRFYAIGGRDSEVDATIDDVDMYDFATGEWSTLDTSLPTPRGGFATAVIGDEILVIGGEGDGTTFEEVEAFDTRTETWRTLAPMPMPRHGIQAAVCNETVYVAAGGEVQYAGAPTSAHEAFSFDGITSCPDPANEFTQIDWSSVPQADPVARAEAQGIEVDGRIYAFGGYESDWARYCTTRRSHVLDASAEPPTWRAIDAPLPDYFTHAGLARDGERLYVAGVRLQPDRSGEGDTSCSSVERGSDKVWTFDLASETWSTELPPLPAARSSTGVARVGRWLHVFGGTNAATTAEAADHWALDLDDPGSGWSARAPLPDPRNHMGVVALDGYIYAMGGQVGTGAGNVPQDAAHRYDPVEDAWERLAPLPEPQSHLGATIAIGRRVVVFGGERVGNGNPVDDVLAYDPETDAWTALTPLPSWGGRAGVAGFVDGEIVYVRGEFEQDVYRGSPVLD